ncbi:MAG: GlmU family protein [Bacteroidales bacterium]|nr:GlmU family protein [Bacteroidales bacterium]
MNYILFDDYVRDELLPFTFVRPVADIRIGIMTIREKWQSFIRQSLSSYTEEYLSNKFPLKTESDNILINGSVLPDANLLQKIKILKINQVLIKDSAIIAMRLDSENIKSFNVEDFEKYEKINVTENIFRISNLWDIFEKNGNAIKTDFEILTRKRKSQRLGKSNKLIGDKRNLFIEEGAKIECSTINTNTGCIYIGRNAEIMEGSLIRGPFALCENSTVKMGAKIYGPTTIGPHSKAGGEIVNSVIFGYSNKAHDGFLGNSVIGEWCNIGADTNNSNLKNNYGNIKLWNYPRKKFVNTGLQFCGLFMGDYSKCGINTMFNTGTVVGTCANIFGSGFPRNFLPSFSWGGVSELTNFDLDKAIEVAGRVCQRRNIVFGEIDKEIFANIYKQTQLYRDL